MTYDKSSKMPFGKHEGKPLSEVPKEYLLWIYESYWKLDIGLKQYIRETYLTENK